MATELIIDAWTPLSFKRSMGNTHAGGVSWVAPTWVGEDNLRRLQAYKILRAYLDNAGREYIEAPDEDTRLQHREYGDAALLRDQILSALLGNEQVISTQDADRYDPNLDKKPNVENFPEVEEAYNFQQWAKQWADDERLPMKMIETERNGVGIGDGVYTLGWNADKQRCRLRVWDPGFYFPSLDSTDDDDYPRRVHIAWEEEVRENGAVAPGKMRVRRITWDLRRMPDGQTQRLPWNSAPTPWCCYMSDGTWIVRPSETRTPDDFVEAAATWADYELPGGETIPWRDIPLGIDFVPVVHIPNTVAEQDHFGQASIARVLQILDDIANADTDLAAASGTAGAPVVALSGGSLQNQPSYKPGTVFSLPESGKMSWLDTSRSLDALIKYVQMLLERLQINSRVPSAVVGRLKPSEVPSGIALALSFGPLRSMIDEMRLVRANKYPLLFKFAHRITWVNTPNGARADLPPEYLPTTVAFGSFLPNDIAAAVDAIEKLSRSRAVSFETMVSMLMQAGLPIADAEQEVRRIQSRDFEAAARFYQASGQDHGAVMSYLGRDHINPPPPPQETPGSRLDADKDGIIHEPGFE